MTIKEASISCRIIKYLRTKKYFPILIRQLLDNFIAIADITIGNVKAEKLGQNLIFINLPNLDNTSIYIDKDNMNKNVNTIEFLFSNEFKYPAKQRLAGAAKTAKVGLAGSGIDFTIFHLQTTSINKIR